jgi:prepilin-type N-terminal cleavage/methylation domain-containing protein
MKPSLFSKKSSGFTLSEVLITMAISTMVAASAMTLFIYMLERFQFDMGKNLVNRDIRAFTSELTDNATYANSFQIYPSFSSRSTTTTATPPVTTSNHVEDKQTGDMLVLIFKDPTNVDLISRIVGYYRAPLIANDATSEGPVRKFDLRFNPPRAATTPIYSLLPNLNTYSTNKEVIELSRGLANGRLFYNVRRKGILVNGEIIHRGGFRKGDRYERATNTYNFTISPRG